MPSRPNSPENQLPAGMQPLLLNAEQTANLLKLNSTTLRAFAESGVIPRPVRFGEGHGSPRWRVDELRDWTRAGCPHADRWKWQAAVPVEIGRLIGILRADADSLAEEVAALEKRKRAGETHANAVGRVESRGRVLA